MIVCADTNSFSPFVPMEPIELPTTTTISAPAITYGAHAIATVSVASTSVAIGSVQLSLNAGTAVSMPLTGGSAVFDLGVLPARTHSVSANFAEQNGFLASSASTNLSVTPVPLVISGNSTSRQYGQTNSVFGGAGSGFVNGDSLSTLSGQLSCLTSAAASTPAGTYSIDCSSSTLSSPNYIISYVPGTLTITPVPLTLTANNQSKVYGAALPTFGFSPSGFVNGDTSASLTTPPMLSTTATAASVVGSYPITIGGAVDPNYSITYVAGTLAVTPVLLTVTANNASRLYGAADPSFTASYSGFVGTDTSALLSGTLSCASTDTVASLVGTYAINCSGLSSPNYLVHYAPGSLTIKPAPLMVTAGNAQRVYGAANPVFTGTITGIQNADSIGATYTTTATTASFVGTHAIMPTLVDPSGKLGNYTVTLINGTLTIIQASTTTALSLAPNPSNFGQSLTLTARVAPVAPGSGIATGKVTFLDGSVTLGTGMLSSADTAAYTTSSLAAGTHTLTASYGGDPNFIASASTALGQQVVCGLSIGISPSTVARGGFITVTGTLRFCATTTQTVVIKFTLSGPAAPNSCGSTDTDMFATPPFALAPNTLKTLSFPFKVPSGVCPGTYSITATTLVNGVAVNTSTATLTITAH
jgi:hypothetical protein